VHIYPVLEEQDTLGSFDTPEGVVTPGCVKKLVLELDDKNAVEAILIGHFGPRVNRALQLDNAFSKKVFDFHPAQHLPYLQKKIAYETCISTQVGCPLDCQFCASSVVDFARNLTKDEILREIATVEAHIPKGGQLRRVLFAGVGEPLMNYDNVSAVARDLNKRNIVPKFNTVGVIPYLKKLFEEGLECELALSIHAPTDALRETIMPAAKGYKLGEICEVISQAPPTVKFIEAKYLMLKDINDELRHAKELAKIFAGLPVFVCLQIYNQIDERDYEPSEPERVREFARTLREHGITVDILNSNIGKSIDGGCGQLRARVTKRRGSLKVVN
jgi:23S rRNA (adenine2503-C2)-methyltransferase